MAVHGRLWQTDDRGILLNDARREHIQPPFTALLDDIVTAYLQHIEADLHSLYLTGSVARGLAVAGASDIDVFGVLESQVDPELVMQDWILLAEERLLKIHPCVTDVRLELWPQGYIFRDPDEFSIGAFIIVTQSVCLWGSDLTPELPVYNLKERMTRLAIANDDIVQLMPEIDEAWERLEADASPDNVRYWCRRIAKNMLRTGFSLTMGDNIAFTRDVDVALAHVCRAFPEQAAALTRAQQWVTQPTDDVGVLMDWLDTQGEWLIDRCEDWLAEHNPEHRECFYTGEIEDE